MYSYPGNVRELQNIVRSLLVEVRGGTEIHDKHVVAVFSRHRVGGVTPTPQKPATQIAPPPPPNVEDVGGWVGAPAALEPCTVAVTNLTTGAKSGCEVTMDTEHAGRQRFRHGPLAAGSYRVTVDAGEDAELISDVFAVIE